MAKVLWAFLTLIPVLAVAIEQGQAQILQEVTDRKFEAHRISGLPGAPNVTFAQYSGYITVDEEAGRALFYWLIEADVEDPTSAPLTLWLNGGPGCSSVGGGVLSELGPFFPDKSGTKLTSNSYSWNKVSNMLFLESPAGVGFSYSNTSSDYTTGDSKTAADSVEFLLRFLELYPVYAKRPFYITGESYAGHYVPQLAAAVLEKNKELGDSAINFKGIAVGNAWTDTASDNLGALFYWWSHAFISDKSYYGVLENCDLSTFGPLQGTSKISTECNTWVREAEKQLRNINIYQVYADVCVSSHALAESKHFAKQVKEYGIGSIVAGPLLESDSYDPCIDDEVDVYLNLPEVQKALHSDVPGISYRWAICSYVLRYSYRDLLTGVLPVYDILLKSGIQILVFSGDLDAIVPVTGTRAWINSLNLTITSDWRQYIVNQQVGGYVTEYDGLTFATVRGAGHMVPYTQPERALYLFKSFIEKSSL